jgi:hypothetical protein
LAKRLELEITVAVSDASVMLTARIHLVGGIHPKPDLLFVYRSHANELMYPGLCQRALDGLLSKDRHDEAFEILVKYHAEGDRDSPLVAAEFEQIRETIKLELESTKNSWKDLVKTGANRRRVFIAACVGPLFSMVRERPGLVSVWSTLSYRISN